jgi:hypothetical protein
MAGMPQTHPESEFKEQCTGMFFNLWNNVVKQHGWSLNGRIAAPPPSHLCAHWSSNHLKILVQKPVDLLIQTAPKEAYNNLQKKFEKQPHIQIRVIEDDRIEVWWCGLTGEVQVPNYFWNQVLRETGNYPECELTPPMPNDVYEKLYQLYVLKTNKVVVSRHPFASFANCP